jgi:hypothetical protein
MSNLAGEGNTGSGFLVGTEPAQPRTAVDWPTQQQTPAQQVSQPAVVVPQQNQVPQGRLFTEEDINKARQQEKDKLYDRIEQMNEQLKVLQQEREAAEAARKAEADRVAEDLRKKEEAELSTRALLEKKEQEWDGKFAALTAQREQDRAVFEQERRLAEVESYRIARVAQESEFILPVLRDLVRGNTIEEIDASIQEMKQRTDVTMQGISEVTSQQPAAMYRGAAPTAPPIGPMEQLSTTQRLTPEDIRSMDIETYKKYRDSLMASASAQYRGRG